MEVKRMDTEREVDAETALLALGGVLTWKRRQDGALASLHNKSHCRYFINPFIRAGNYGVGLVLWSRNDGTCGFACATVRQARAICEHYDRTGDWATVKRLKAESDAADKLLWERESLTCAVADRGHALYLITSHTTAEGCTWYKATWSYFARRWRKLNNGVVGPITPDLFPDDCSVQFDCLADAKAACERHLMTSEWENTQDG